MYVPNMYSTGKSLLEISQGHVLCSMTVDYVLISIIHYSVFNNTTAAFAFCYVLVASLPPVYICIPRPWMQHSACAETYRPSQALCSSDCYARPL